MTGISEKQKKQFIFIACLFVVLLLLVIYNVNRTATIKARRRQAAVAVPVAPTSATAESPEVPGDMSLAVLKERAKAVQWGRDPFMLDLGGEALPTLQLHVTGIIYDPTQPEATYAIINEEVVRIGDSIRGIKVVDIQTDSVRLKKFNQEFTLYLYQDQEP